MRTRHVLLSGLPYIGKTTALLRIIESYPAPWAGFVTERLSNQDKKIGLTIVTDDGIHRPVAWKQPSMSRRNAGYDVDEPALLSALDRILDRLNVTSFVYMDEINPLFCRLQGFRDRVKMVFSEHPVAAVVSRKGHRLIRELWNRPDICSFEIDACNRDAVPGMVVQHLRSLNAGH